MGYKYVILGAGIQGTAAAFDMVQFGQADSVLLLDVSEEQAIKAANRINQLTGTQKAVARSINVKDQDELIRVLKEQDVCLSAVPYYFNPQVTACAIKAGVHLCDLGGNTDIVFQQLEMNAQAKEVGVSVVPDCGLMPGMGNTIAAHGIAQLDECETVNIRCGGLPQNPKPPLDYKLVFSIGGLTNEYFGRSAILRDGKIMYVNTFTGLEQLTLPEPLGKCEAFVTSGGTSTCPWTYEGQVQNYDYKTVRYPGHYEKFKLLLDLGLLDLEPVEVDGQSVVPRHLFHTVATPKLDFPEDKDLAFLQVCCSGRKNGKALTLRYTILDYEDEKTGFNAMARTTGFSAAIVAFLMAKGQVPHGVVPLEKAVPPQAFIEELEKRGIAVKQEVLD